VRVRWIAAVLAAVGLLACVSWAAGPAGVWLDVPFVKQETNGCGAASISMVMQYWARQRGTLALNTADAAAIQSALYSTDAHGIYASSMERYFREHHFRTFSFPGQWSDLQEHLAAGRPLIVALKSGRAAMHYVVVTGLDGDHSLVLVNDPAQRKLLKVARSDFEHEWSGADHWTLLAIPQPTAQ